MKQEMNLEQKYAIEREKFDEIASHTNLDEAALLMPGENFDHAAENSTYLPGIAEFFGDLTGKRVLEIGCGVGRTSVLLAKSGAILSAFDISEKSVEVARERARLNDLADRIDFRTAVAEDMPYEDETFDFVFGSAILHHIEADSAGPEIYRVMRPGARAGFSEPLANNRFVEFARDHLWYPRKASEGADAPLTYADLEAWRDVFDGFEFREIHLLGMLERLTAWRWQFKTLHRWDTVLTKKYPFLRSWCNYAVIFANKTQPADGAAGPVGS